MGNMVQVTTSLHHPCNFVHALPSVGMSFPSSNQVSSSLALNTEFSPYLGEVTHLLLESKVCKLGTGDICSWTVLCGGWLSCVL